MFGTTFGHGLLEKYTATFGTLFNNIYITRQDEDGARVQSIKVPIIFSPRDPALTREAGDPNFKRPASMTIPRMGFNITSINYDSNRKLNSLNRTTSTASPRYRAGRSTVYQSVPYEVIYSLSIIVQNIQDGLQIVEQILPYFTPAFVPRIKLVEGVDLEMDCPISISSISQRDNYDGSLEALRRTIEWQIDFVMKVYFIGPVNEAKVIKTATIDLFMDETAMANEKPAEIVVVKPGLTANGEPTIREENSIPVNEIKSTDDYGYITKIITPD